MDKLLKLCDKKIAITEKLKQYNVLDYSWRKKMYQKNECKTLLVDSNTDQMAKLCHMFIVLIILMLYCYDYFFHTMNMYNQYHGLSCHFVMIVQCSNYVF